MTAAVVSPVREKAEVSEQPPAKRQKIVAERIERTILENVDMMVCDMAGTTVQEGGVVYKTLRRVMQQHGLTVSEADMHPWHGAKKEAVIEHFAKQAGLGDTEREEKVVECSKTFTKAIDEAYFGAAAEVGPIGTGLMSWFQRMKEANIKITLDTGYPQNIQEGLVKKLGFDKVVDGYVSSYEVREGRPYPYMIHRLMESTGVSDVRRVAKIGDSCRDVEMGKNAGCGLVVGVLSGADGADELYASGADLVIDVITDLPVPAARTKAA